MHRQVKVTSSFGRLREALQYVSAFAAAHPRVARTVKFLALLTIFFLLSLRRLDPDFGWHLQAGNFIWAHGIPAHDIFTYTARSFAWIDHEWGNDIIVSLFFGLGGYLLVAVLFGLIWSGALVIAGWHCRWLTLLLAAIALFPYGGIRVIAWTALLLALTFVIVRSPHRKYVWLLLPLFTVWANLHGGFIVGLAVVLYIGFYRRRLDVLAIWPLALLATFINPYGPHLYVEIARTLLDPSLHAQISEWAPLLIESPVFVFLIIWGLGTVAYGHLPLKRWLRPSVIMLLGALSAARNFPLFIITATPEVNTYIPQLWRSVTSKSDWPVRLMAACIVCFLAAMAVYGACVSFLPIQDREAAYPGQAVTYLRQHGCAGGNLFNSYDYGGYLIWKLPQLPVYIDGRMPSWRDKNGQKYMDHYEALAQGRIPYQADFSTYNIRCAVIEKGEDSQPLVSELDGDGWKTVVSTDNYVLLMAS